MKIKHRISCFGQTFFIFIKKYLKTYTTLVILILATTILVAILYINDLNLTLNNYHIDAYETTPSSLHNIDTFKTNISNENHVDKNNESNQNDQVYIKPEDQTNNSNNAPYLVITPSVLLLGGENLNSGTITVRMSDGSSLSPVVLDYSSIDKIYFTTNPSFYADTDPLPTTAQSRNIYVWDAYSSSSGSTTVKVKTQYGDYSGSFIVKWSPVATYESADTSMTEKDNGDTITYSFGFSITPKGSFGNPTIMVSVYNNGVCINDTETRKIFTYNNQNTFNVSCTVEKEKDYHNEKLEARIDSITREDGYGIIGEDGGYTYELIEGYDK